MYQHDWASFRFQLVRAVAEHPLSLRTVGEFFSLQFGLVGFVLLPVVISGVALTAWRGARSREPVAILLVDRGDRAVLVFPLEVADLAGRRYLADVPVAGGICRHRHQLHAARARKISGLDGEVDHRLDQGCDRHRHRLRRRRVLLLRRSPLEFHRPHRSGRRRGRLRAGGRGSAQSVEENQRDLDRHHGLSHLRDAALAFQRTGAGDPDQRARPLSRALPIPAWNG